MARPHIEPFLDRRSAGKKFSLPGFPSGMKYRMLSLDTDTGACTMAVQFGAGYQRPPGFSYADMELLIVDGELTVGEQRCAHGYYFFVPAGVALPALASARGCEALLMYNTGAPSFEESDSDHPLADRTLYAAVDSYAGLDWSVPTFRPRTASGCMLKLLHYHPRTEALSFLYCMTPDFHQDNISYHDCAEESYHLWGTSWMMQFGDLPTGGYFWRPAYINHGAFASKLGCLAFGRTTSQLYNHFHYNPWSNVKENQERVAARLAWRNPHLYKWVRSHGHNHPEGPKDFDHLHDEAPYPHRHG